MGAAKNASMEAWLVRRPIFTPEDSGENADRVVDSLEELMGDIS
jgi:FMN phosphatase YigB (HAD superfamily)